MQISVNFTESFCTDFILLKPMILPYGINRGIGYRMTGQQLWDLSSLNVKVIGCSAFSSFNDHAVSGFAFDALPIFLKPFFYMFCHAYDDYLVPEQTVF